MNRRHSIWHRAIGSEKLAFRASRRSVRLKHSRGARHHHRHGVTLLEMLIVLAVMGILMSIGIVNLHPERFSVQQAITAVSSEISSTRLEAIRKNQNVGVQFQVPNNQYVVYLDNDTSRTYSSGDTILTTQAFNTDPYKGVNLSSIAVGGSSLNTFDVIFDARGIPRMTQAATMTLTNTGGSFSKQLAVSLQGKAKSL
jgi:type IV fimbrial biogenesis protein FimT